MFWARFVGGILLVLLGAIWIGQGLNLIKGSGMSGHAGYAVVGVVVALCGLWLLWGVAQTRMGVRRG
ncbi:MAG TPA: hypothetical protein VNL71_06560 [Chloroflexota bacterium]|nr:hypothetical protein [Chloroflexota bacterium]